ncbi:MAG: FxsA family protein [Planctomycetota bacterium]|nr:FxsA family protein [Planctomycetaceae bacterium]MDQ3329483.1 FxsA family protein [Planctomycetota bacterium]
MFFRLLLLFTLVPIVELAILIWLTRQTSVLTTAAIVLSTGFLGAALAKWQGFKAWIAIRSDLAAGRAPAVSVADGVLILFAGAFLLTPGLLTDVVGFSLLVPRVRAALRKRLLDDFRRRVETRVRTFTARAGGFAEGDVIDAEFRRADAPPIEERER